jgi:2-dehydro-3-deoxygluconokinase
MAIGEQPAGSDAIGWKIHPQENARWDLLSLGEVLLRFDPGEQRITRTRSFRVWEGGGEYNVARGLRRCFGMRTTIATSLVDNQIGRLVEDLMLQGGVDVSNVRWVEFDGVGRQGRNGVYFLERGFGIRHAQGMMDRGHTAISQLRPNDFDWNALFAKGVRWFHTGGIMAALSDHSPAVIREAMEAAKRHGAIVSFDCNYRPSLWQTRGGREGAVRVNRLLMPFVDVLFGHEGDVAENLGASSRGPVWHTLDSFREASERIVTEFPKLGIIASTVRKPHTASRNHWSAFAYTQGIAHEGLRFDDLEILDRVGGGDAFASGLIYGMLAGKGMRWALNCGVVHGALCMSTPGDGSMSTLPEIERLLAGELAGTIR